MSGNVTIAILSAAAVAAILPSPHSSTADIARSPPGSAGLTPDELHNYAETLIELRRIERNLNDRLAQAPAAAAATLHREADEAIAAALLHHELGTERFNQISHRIVGDATARRTVRQFVMQERSRI